MKQLVVNGANAEEIADHLGQVADLLRGGFTSGELLDGWDLSEVEEDG